MHPFNQTDLFCREESLARVLRDFPGVEVVISSSWRETHTLKNMLTFFLTDLRSRIVGVTPVIEIRDAVDVPGVRLREINKYLVDTGNQHRRWVALDDAPELFLPKKSRFGRQARRWRHCATPSKKPLYLREHRAGHARVLGSGGAAEAPPNQ